jgi:hypothetical protein
MEARPLISALAIATTLALGACGSTTTVTKTVTVTNPAHGNAAATVTGNAATTTRTTTANSESAHRAASGYKRCDANIRAKRVTTTCGFAENAFYAYFIGSGATTLRVYSPATGRTFTTRCSEGTATVTCRTADGGVVKFRQSAIAAYSDDQAGAFAAAHEVGDSGVVDAATSASSGSSGSSSSDDTYSNPYDSPDTTVDPGDDPAFCDTHDCIPNYPNGNGSTVQCADGSYSHSGGIQGACSHHGGVG